VEIDLTEEEMVAIKERVAVLRIEHRDLDEVIGRLAEDPVQDELQLKRLKMRKLLLKDHMRCSNASWCLTCRHNWRGPGSRS
jgi:hypothetical protein